MTVTGLLQNQYRKLQELTFPKTALRHEHRLPKEPNLVRPVKRTNLQLSEVFPLFKNSHIVKAADTFFYKGWGWCREGEDRDLLPWGASAIFVRVFIGRILSGVFRQENQNQIYIYTQTYIFIFIYIYITNC